MRNKHQHLKPIYWQSRMNFFIINKQNCVFKPIRRFLKIFQVLKNNHFACVSTTKIFTGFAEPFCQLLLIQPAIFCAYNIHNIVFFKPIGKLDTFFEVMEIFYFFCVTTTKILSRFADLISKVFFVHKYT